MTNDVEVYHTDMSFSLNYVHSLISQTFVHYAGGPFPMIKQEQLSPRSSSCQPDNLSAQGAPHDSAAGRGGWLIFSYFIIIHCKVAFTFFSCPL